MKSSLFGEMYKQCSIYHKLLEHPLQRYERKMSFFQGQLNACQVKSWSTVQVYEKKNRRQKTYSGGIIDRKYYKIAKLPGVKSKLVKDVSKKRKKWISVKTRGRVPTKRKWKSNHTKKLKEMDIFITVRNQNLKAVCPKINS